MYVGRKNAPPRLTLCGLGPRYAVVYRIELWRRQDDVVAKMKKHLIRAQQRAFPRLETCMSELAVERRIPRKSEMKNRADGTCEDFPITQVSTVESFRSVYRDCMQASMIRTVGVRQQLAGV